MERRRQACTATNWCEEAGTRRTVHTWESARLRVQVHPTVLMGRWRCKLGCCHLLGFADPAYDGLHICISCGVGCSSAHSITNPAISTQVALLSGIPFGVATVSMVINARLSKRANERRLHIFLPVAWGAAGLMCVRRVALHGMHPNGCG